MLPRNVSLKNIPSRRVVRCRRALRRFGCSFVLQRSGSEVHDTDSLLLELEKGAPAAQTRQKLGQKSNPEHIVTRLGNENHASSDGLNGLCIFVSFEHPFWADATRQFVNKVNEVICTALLCSLLFELYHANLAYCGFVNSTAIKDFAHNAAEWDWFSHFFVQYFLSLRAPSESRIHVVQNGSFVSRQN